MKSDGGLWCRTSPTTWGPGAIAARSLSINLSLPLAAALLIAFSAGPAGAQGPSPSSAPRPVAPAATPSVELPVAEVPNGEEVPAAAPDSSFDPSADSSSDTTSEVEGIEEGEATGEATGEASSNGSDVAERMAELERRLEATQELVTRQRPLVTVGGYVDVGLLRRRGDGTGIYQDVGPNRRATFRSTPTTTAGCSWATCWPRRSTAAASRPISGNLPGVDRFDSVHSRGAPGFIVNEVNLTLERRPRRQRARHGQHQLHAALGDRLPPRRRLRGRPGAAGMDARRAPAHVDLRRQDRLGAGHRVPRAQGEPALRHHAVAHRPLHDRDAARDQGPQQAGRRTTG